MEFDDELMAALQTSMDTDLPERAPPAEAVVYPPVIITEEDQRLVEFALWNRRPTDLLRQRVWMRVRGAAGLAYSLPTLQEAFRDAWDALVAAVEPMREPFFEFLCANHLKMPQGPSNGVVASRFIRLPDKVQGEIIQSYRNAADETEDLSVMIDAFDNHVADYGTQTFDEAVDSWMHVQYAAACFLELRTGPSNAVHRMHLPESWRHAGP